MALLDTNVLLAAVIQPEHLPEAAQTLLQDRANRVYFSAVSLWEIAIKRSLNRSGFDFRSEDIEQLARETGFTELPLHCAHCHGVGHMPWHHRDPFDRLLVAQAQFLPARFLTSDGQLARYSELVWAFPLR